MAFDGSTDGNGEPIVAYGVLTPEPLLFTIERPECKKPTAQQAYDEFQEVSKKVKEETNTQVTSMHNDSCPTQVKVREVYDEKSDCYGAGCGCHALYNASQYVWTLKSKLHLIKFHT